jgi:hypothetical protein
MQCLGIQMPNFYYNIFAHFVKFATALRQDKLRSRAALQAEIGQAPSGGADSVAWQVDRLKPAWT